MASPTRMAGGGTGSPVVLWLNPDVQKVTVRVHQSIPTLETPGLSIELLKAAKHNFVRLVSKDEAKIHNELINPELNKVWRGEEGAASAARRIAAQVIGFLKANPAVTGHPAAEPAGADPGAGSGRSRRLSGTQRQSARAAGGSRVASTQKAARLARA